MVDLTPHLGDVNGKYVLGCKRPPVGISDFPLVASRYYYVDKTLLIRDVLASPGAVNLFTRPRRFGKTLNMSMLQTFFEKTDEDTSIYFQDKKIWACGDEYRQEQGKYPVIYLTFKDANRGSWSQTYIHILRILQLEFARHQELQTSKSLNIVERNYLSNFLEKDACEADAAIALKMLSQMLHKHHGIKPILLIDEYDTPIQDGHFSGYYDQVIQFMRGLFAGGLKDNSHITFACLTGILRVAKESLFSGLNNLDVYSVLDDEFSEYFGFTHEEVREMAANYHVEDRMSEICSWYDGYLFGGTKIFNPWSIGYYFKHRCKTGAHWVSTSGNGIIYELLSLSDQDTTRALESLLQGEKVSTQVDTNVIYPEINTDSNRIFTFLLMSGYLTVAEASNQSSRRGYNLTIPNFEIREVYQDEILNKLKVFISKPLALDIQYALMDSDITALKKSLSDFLLQAVSYYDTAKEDFYHGLVLGLCASMGEYHTLSNRESGEGRYDICMTPKTGQRVPGILIELKAERGAEEERLKALAIEALKQISEKHYDTDLQSAGVKTIFKYGVAFGGKKVEIVTETMEFA